MPVTTTPFPLGAYLGNPDNSSPANEALYQAKDASFTALMGVGPRFLTTFVDQRQTVAQWTGNSQFFADSAAQSPDAKGMTPVIALPLSSTALGSGTPSQQFQAFAAGQYDNVIAGIVRVWAQRGFANLVIRPGWEMNLPGSNYAGDDAQSQAGWVRAFQHVYTVLHQAAAANGVNVQVVWNPGVTNYSNAGATASLYPGDDHVDIVGADMYSDIYPYSDSPTPSYHDWHTGLQDTTVAQFIADPINREHYWSLPAATAYSSDASGGHSQSLDSLIRFAEAHGKPFAMPETGAGNSDAGTGVKDDGAFPGWLAAQLAASTARGGKVAFVNLWDSNGGGNYQFSAAADGKPQEAAAWAKYFGAAAVSTPTLTPVAGQAPGAVVLGSGAHALQLLIAEDAWQGDATFMVSVDGQQVGGTQVATASRAAGASQTFDVRGNFAARSHSVSVNFLNDAWGGSAATDRNLYVTAARIDGATIAGASLSLERNGAQGFSFAVAALPAALDTLTLSVSEDAWQGDAKFTVSIDGASIGGMMTATASHASGATGQVSLTGAWGAGPHTVGVSFINDAWGGTPATDRNLYVDRVAFNGRAAAGAPATLFSNGTASFAVGASPAAATLNLHLAEDTWQGDAGYSVSIDGSVVASGLVTASNALGQSQAVIIQQVLTAGAHDLAVSFLNDAWGGTPATDRNLFIKGFDVNGTPAAGASRALFSAGTEHFQFLVPG